MPPSPSSHAAVVVAVVVVMFDRPMVSDWAGRSARSVDCAVVVVEWHLLDVAFGASASDATVVVDGGVAAGVVDVAEIVVAVCEVAAVETYASIGVVLTDWPFGIALATMVH